MAAPPARGRPGVLDPGVRLDAPRPNPFVGETRFRISLARSGALRVLVCDAAGRVLERLVSGRFDRGDYVFHWDGCDALRRPLGSGVYFVTAQAAGWAVKRAIYLVR